MIPGSSAMDSFVLCSVHDTHNIFLEHLFSNAFMCFVMLLAVGYMPKTNAGCSYYA